jgi:hypothetical protein
MRAPRLPSPLALAAALLVAGTAPAQIDRPEGSGRLIRAWDFEDREVRPEPVPMHWFRVFDEPGNDARSPGFPRWNLAELDGTHAHGGRWSVKLPTRGGSVGLALAGGVAPVIPGSDLLLTAWVRTADVEHAGARLVARLLDERLEPIDGAELATDPIRSNQRWSFVRLDVPANDDATWIQLELQLLQPAQLTGGPPPLGEPERQDLGAAAWFDDVHLYQAPRLLIHTRSEANLDVGPDRPTIALTVRDLTGESLTATISVVAWDGSVVARTRSPVTPDGAPVEWTPPLPRYGWYRAIARVASGEGDVAQTSCDLAWLAPAWRPVEPDDRFGVAIRDDEREALELVPRLVERLGVGRVWLDVWQRARRRLEAQRDVPAARVALGEIETVTERLLERGTRLTFVLERAPDHLATAAQADPDNVMAILSGEPDGWLADLRPLLSRFGERVRRWQIGAIAAPHAADAPDLGVDVASIHRVLFRLIPRPIVVVPWPAHAAGADRGAGGEDAPERALAVWVPDAVPHDAMPRVVGGYPDGLDTAIVLDRTDPQSFGVRAMVRDAATRAVRAWAAGADAVVIEAPWTWRGDRDRDAAPGPLMPVWRTLAESLAGRTAVGELPVAPGATAILVGDPETDSIGAIVAWNDTAPAHRAVIHGYLGDGEVVRRDLFGNHAPVPADDDGERHIPLGRLPLIIEGVDLDLLRFRSALRIEPSFIETRAKRHDVELVITNPWRTAIGGRLRLGSPDNWRIKPRVFELSVPPSGEQRVPLEVIFGLNELAGPRELVAEVRLSAERRYPTIRLPVPVELGLEDLEVSPAYRFIDGAAGPGADLVLTVLVTNTGHGPLSLDAQALARGRAMQESTIHALQPGQTTLRRFRFDDARADLLGTRLRLTIRERDGAGRFNRWIDVR